MFKPLSKLDIVTQAKLACIYSGVVWGVYWIPLRLMDQAGVYAAWSTVLFYAVPFLFFLPWTARQWLRIKNCRKAWHWIGITTGCSLVLYANAMLYTEVVRAVLLYYLTPIWSLLLARIVLGEVITPPRVAAILLGIAGMLVILRIDQGTLLPGNIGDWMGLLAGLGWAVAAVLLRQDDGSHAHEFSTLYFFYGTLAAIALALSPIAGEIEVPDIEAIWSVLPWFMVIGPVLLIPGIYAAFWGAPHLNPGVVGLLFMTEISVAAITAALWANEPFGVRELSGVVLISLAGLTEFLWPSMQRLRRFVRSGKQSV